MEHERAYLPGPGHSIGYLQSRSFLSPLITIGTTNQALPLFTILVAQLVALILLAYFVSFRMMGRDYDSAVMASGFIGFAMGTTANAVVNMRALVARFGAAPGAFLVIPLVGLFFIDFANALIVTGFVNWVK
jgi:ESS family glutamate:Na+ symporter